MSHQNRNEVVQIPHIFDAGDSESVNDQHKSMKSHFRTFMEKEMGILNTTLDDLAFEDINDDLVGKFAMYLCSTAINKNAKKSNTVTKLASQSCINYMSSFKNYLLRKHHAHGDIPFLSSSRMTMIYRKMWRYKINEMASSGDVSKVYPTPKTFTGDEFKPLAAIALWTGDRGIAEFFHLATSMVSNVGRGSEIAILDWDKVQLVQIHEPDNQTYHTLQTHVFRLKTATSRNRAVDTVTSFLHSSDLLQCLPTAMLYHVVLDDTVGNETSSKIFREWNDVVIQASRKSSKRKRDNNPHDDPNTSTVQMDKTVRSAVQKLFQRRWKSIIQLAQEYIDDIPENSQNTEDEEVLKYIDKLLESGINDIVHSLTVHDPKRIGIFKLGNKNLAPQHISARAGWLLKSFHTFFDYWCGSVASMQITGKRMAGWDCGFNGDSMYTSGRPPSLNDTGALSVVTDRFVEVLLGHQKQISMPVKRFLVAIGILRWDDICAFVQGEPTGKYTNFEMMRNNHPYIRKWSDALDVCKIDYNVEFMRWKQNIVKKFHMYNMFSVPAFMEKIGEFSLQTIPPNVSIGQHMTMQDSRLQFLTHSLYESKMKLSQLTHEVGQMRSQLGVVMQQQSEIIRMLKGNHKAAEDGLQDKNDGNSEVTASAPVEYNILIQRVQRESCLADQLYMLISSDYEKSYQGLATGKKKAKKVYSTYKKTIDFVISKSKMDSDVFKMQNDSLDMGEWKVKVKMGIENALKDISEEMGVECSKLTKTKVYNHALKQMNNDSEE